jgi:flagellar protein FlaI
MESVQIDIDAQDEELVPRPEPPEWLLEETGEILNQAEPLFERYRDMDTASLISTLEEVEQDDGELEPTEENVDFGQFVPKAGAEAEEE